MLSPKSLKTIGHAWHQSRALGCRGPAVPALLDIACASCFKVDLVGSWLPLEAGASAVFLPLHLPLQSVSVSSG